MLENFKTTLYKPNREFSVVVRAWDGGMVMAQENTGGIQTNPGQADDRALLDDLTVLAQPAAAAPQSGEARQTQESDRGGGITELAAIHQGSPDLAARFVPVSDLQIGGREADAQVAADGAAPARPIDAIVNAAPTGPENTPRDYGHEGEGEITTPLRAGGNAAPADSVPPPATSGATEPRGAAQSVPAPPPAQSPAAAAAPAEQATAVPPPLPRTETPETTEVKPLIITAGAPAITTQAATGEEDTAIPLNITAVTTDGGDSIRGIVLSNIPAGSVLNHGTRLSDTSWSLSPADLPGLTITPPKDFGGTITMTVTATAWDSGLTATSTATAEITVQRVADTPTLDAAAARGDEDTAIALDITPHLSDTDGSEAITAVTITGVPAGAALSAGTHNSDGSWTLTPAQLAGLKITPPSHSAVDFTLTVTTTSTELSSDPAPVAAGKATATSAPVTLHVTVDGVAHAPAIIQNTAAAGDEDSRINLNLDLSTFKADETLSGLTITGVPAGSHFYSAATGGNAVGHDNADGSWTFSETEVAAVKASSLFIQPPRDWNDYNTAGQGGMALNATLDVRQTDPESGAVTTNSTSLPLTVHVAAVADQPTVTATAARGDEDSAIALDITPHLTDLTSTEAITAVTITGVPAGAALSAGTHNSDGSWTLTPAQLAGLKITPPSHSAVDFTLTVTTTSTELGDNAAIRSAVSEPVSLHVTVDGVATTALVHAGASAGNEDSRIDLNLSLADTDAGEALSLTLAGIPAGSHFYDAAAGGAAIGHDNGDGTWTFSETEVAAVKASSLFIQPPRDWNDYNTAGQGGMRVTATLTANQTDPESGAVTPKVTTQSFAVHVAGVADQPTVTATAARGDEDSAIALDITPHLTDLTSTEAITAITITGVPAGAALSAGIHNSDGSWTLTPAQLAGLKITPPGHSAVDFTLTVTTTSTELGDNAAIRSAVSEPVSLHVTVDGVATTALVHAGASAGNEDSRIDLNLSLADTDAGEALSLTLAGIPAGSHFYDAAAGGAAIGHDNGDGTWTFSETEVAAVKASSLFIQPPRDWNDYNTAGQGGMRVTATLTANQTDPESGAVTPKVTTQSFAVHVAGVADQPTVTATAARGDEDSAIALDITPHLTDLTSTEAISAVTITGVPAGATLSAGTHNSDGSWTLTPAQLAGLKITPPSHSAANFTLTVTTTSTELGDNAAVRSAVSEPVSLHVTVDGVAHAPVVSLSSGLSGNEDTRIAVDLNMAAFKGDESLSGLTIASQAGSVAADVTALADSTFTTGSGAGVGHYDSTAKAWSFSAEDIAAIKAGGLYIQTPRNWSDWSSSGHNSGLKLAATVTASETDPESHAVTTASTTVNTTVHVYGVADTPTVAAAGASGSQNTGSGAASNWIALDITPGLSDIDGSESVSSLRISNLPPGAVLNQGVNNGDGSWTLTQAQLAGLKILPKAHDSTDFTIYVTATATEAGPNVAAGLGSATSIPVPIKVVVEASAEAPVVTQTAASGNEDTRINVNLTLGLSDTAEQMTGLALAGVPAGSRFYSAATGGVALGTDDGNGNWSFTAAEASAIKAGGLYVLPPSHWSDYDTAGHTAGMQMTATLSAAKTDLESGVTHTSSTTQALTVNVLSVANAPTAMTTAPASGVEYDGTHPDWIALSISVPALNDTDRSETLSVRITGVPSGALLSAGTRNSDGSWSLDPAQLTGLKVQPAAHDAADFTLTITATATEQGVASHIATATASTVATLKVTVDGVADAPTIGQTAAAVGNEDTRINLNLDPRLTDSHETLTMTLAGVPADSTFYAAASGGSAIGTYSPATGLWSFSATEMAAIKAGALYVLPPANWSDWNTAGNTTGMQLTATLTSTQVDPDTKVSTSATAAPFTFGVGVKSVADAPSLTTVAAHGSESDGTTPNWIPLSITTAVTDDDRSESISSVTISQVPNGAKLALADGTVLSPTATGATTSTYTLSQAQLAGLKFQPAPHDARDVTLSITSTSTEAGVASHIATATASTTAGLKITVDGVADAPTLSQTHAAVGNEDTRINLNLDAQLTDSQESLSMTLAGVPANSTFFATASGGAAIGTYSPATGLWSFSSTDMAAIKAGGLYVLPPTNWSDWNTAGGTTGMRLTATLTSTEIDPDSKARTSAGAAPLTFSVEVHSVADTPTVTVSNATVIQNDGGGADGNWVALSISPAVTDTDTSEAITAIRISGVPTGAVLNQGTDNHDGSWTLTPAQLAGLKILPPAHSAADFSLTVVATATEKGDPAHIAVSSADSAARTIRVTVTGTAEAPVVGQTTAAAGLEDSRIDVNLSVVLPDSHESVTGITIGGAPGGTVFYASSDPADATRLGHYDSSTQTWSFTAAEAALIRAGGLFVQPPANWSDWNTAGNTTGMRLVTTVSVAATDPDTKVVSTNSTTATIGVEVKSVADAPTVTAQAARGSEDQPIALVISPHLADTDGSETITAVTITGVPAGATLNHGTDNHDGSWTLTPAQLAGLTITPPTDSKTAFTLHVTATSAEGGDPAHIATPSATSAVVDLKVTVDAVADTPTVTVSNAGGLEDKWIDLSVSAATPDTSGTEVVSVTITGMPPGAILNHGTYDASSGAWTVGQGDLATLKVLPAKDSNADFTLHVQANTLEPSNGSIAHSAARDLTVTVTGTPEAPDFTETAQARGVEDTRIDMHLAGSLTDANEALTLKLAGIPSGSRFFSAAGANLVDGADTTAIGTDNGDGTWSFTTAEVTAIKAGGLFIQPPANWSDWSGVAGPANDWSTWSPGRGGIRVTATLTSTDTDVNTRAETRADTTIDFTVHVSGVADAATGLPDGHFVATQVEDTAGGTSGTLVDLGFGALGLADTDGSEHLSVVVSDLPAGSRLMFADGISIDNLVPVGSGRWSIEAKYLPSLRLLVPAAHNSETDGVLHLNAAVVTTEVDGSVHVDTRVVDVTVTPATNAAHISGGGSGDEEGAIPLGLSVSAGGIAETLDSITLDLTAAHRADAKVFYDGVEITADGITLAGDADLSKFTVKPAANWSDWSSDGHNSGIAIGVTVVSHDHGAAPRTTTQTVAVHVAGTADAPGFAALSNVAIGPDHAATSATLDVVSKVGLTDIDGSERLSMVIDGLPDGALLLTRGGALAGFNEGGGKWLVTADQWDAAVAAGGFVISAPRGLADADGNPVGSSTVTVTALSTERDTGSTAGTSRSFTLSWDGAASGVADPTAPSVGLSGPNVGAGLVSGNEDSAIALGITIGDHAAGLNATLVIDAASLDGAKLSAGIYDSSRNVWLVGESDVAGLKITPPANWNSVEAGHDLSLSARVVFTDTSTGGSTSSALTIPVHVNPVTDAAAIGGGGSGTEDTAIGLNLSAAAGGIDETVTAVVISGVPTGAKLTMADGTVIAPDGGAGSTYTVGGLTPAQLGGLKLIPPRDWSDYSGAINLNVAVTTQDHGAAALTTTRAVAVHVTGVTDAAEIAAAPVSGTENQWIDLSTKLQAALADTDGSEGISIVLAGVPDGAVLNHGYNNGDGTWRLDAADLPTLKLLMPTDFNGQQAMTLQALTWEKDGSSPMVTTSAGFTVTVDAVAGVPSVSVTSARGSEDSPIALTIATGVTHALGTDHIDHVTIAGVPAGATLNQGTDNGDGTWTLAPADLAGLTITPPPHSDAAFTLRITATAAETDSISGAVSTTTSPAMTLDVRVDAVANGGTVTVGGARGDENAWIDLSGSISTGLIDTDGSESLTSVIITGLRPGAVLNHGVLNADGSWTVADGDLATLKVLPPANDARDLTLTVRAVTTEAANGNSAAGPAATFTVVVDAAAAPVTLGQSAPAAGAEDSRIALNLGVLITDPGESATLTMSGVPAGSAFFNAAAGGTAIGVDNHDGTWSFSRTEIDDMQAAGHGLYLVPPTNWSDWSSAGHTAGMPLTATVNASVSDPETHAVSTTSSSLSLTVHVDAVADAPNLDVAPAQGNEDTWIDLAIDPVLADQTGSEYLSAVTISGLPAGATLNHGVLNADGTWTLQTGDLAGLRIKPGGHDVADFDLTVTATSRNWQNGDAASTTTRLHVTVDAVANAPVLTLGAAPGGAEGSRIALNLSMTRTDDHEDLTLALAGVPDGSRFYAGNVAVGTDGGNGTWTFTTEEVEQMRAGGAYIQPPAHWSDWNTAGNNTGMSLTATLTSTQVDPDSHAVSTASTQRNLTVHVSSVADAPELAVADTATTVGSAAALAIDSSLVDTDGSETLSVTISGVPAGATLNHGIRNADGTWTLTKAQLAGLTLTPAAQDSRDIDLTVTATTTEAAGGPTASTSLPMHVTVTPVAHAPGLTQGSPASGNEDTRINLNLGLTSGDSHETLSLTLTGVAGDSHFYAGAGSNTAIGTDHGNGTWSFTGAEVAQIQAGGLFIQPPAHWSDWNTGDNGGGMHLAATLTSTTAPDAETGQAATASSSLAFDLHVASVADAPNLAGGNLLAEAGAQSVPLDLRSSLTDTDGSESLSLRITGLPDDASLNHGVRNADGSWSLGSDDLQGLAISTTARDAGTSTMHVVATATETNGSQASTSADFLLRLGSNLDTGGESGPSLGTVGADGILNLSHLTNLPGVPDNSGHLAEFVFGGLDGVHAIDVTGITGGAGHSLSIDLGNNEHLLVAAGTHGYIDGQGLHTDTPGGVQVVDGNGHTVAQPPPASAFIDTTGVHATLTFDNSVAIHVEGLDKITF
jgi:hypothetical protein